MLDQLKKIYRQSIEKKGQILSNLEPLRVKEEAAIVKLHKAEAELKKIRLKIANYEERHGLADVSRTIATLAPKAKKLK